ncbi:hypothetical protein DPMN_035815 [Dreissena polymorpha]|uniref:Uncharacterized protein n=1 Tax=Dreissena polymorpha TaxID=45954 RepID=A0A9D4RN94_DREPO|nr:hypothetical protein DPMN_035815 [Dreissena polymorpha]
MRHLMLKFETFSGGGPDPTNWRGIPPPIPSLPPPQCQFASDAPGTVECCGVV